MILVHVTLLRQKTLFIIGHKMSVAEVFNYKATKMNLTLNVTCIASYMQIRRTLLP